MKKVVLPILALALIWTAAALPAAAQFPIKIPKVKVTKPQTETPSTNAEEPTPNTADSSSLESPAASSKSGSKGSFEVLPNQPAPNKPVFLLDSLLIRAKTEPRFHKLPNVNDNSSWYPQVEFRVFYDNSVKQRFVAEWFNPDGSPWYTEPLETPYNERSLVIVRSADSQEELSSNAIQTTGTYGVKVTNTKTGDVVFQGKFAVKKLAPEPALKKKFLFYVDNDWNLPMGYVNYYTGGEGYDLEVYPMVSMYFKGNLESKDFEARLYHNGQQITSTDEGGAISTETKRGDECYQFREVCQQTLWTFKWDKFQLENHNFMREKYPNTIFTRDKPGEYTVKIFYRGMQVRETKFTVDNRGWIAKSPYSDRIFPYRYTSVIPVKVMGTLDKWNATTWKTDAFYANPLAGFSVQ
jgi:hypothetical protein